MLEPCAGKLASTVLRGGNHRKMIALLDLKGLEHLKGMSLTSVSFYSCTHLTDKALEHLKGMPLTYFDFGNCKNVTSKALAELKKALDKSGSY